MPWATRLADISTKRPDLSSWVLAILLFVASFGARIVLAQWLDPLKFLTFYPAIAASALLCGWPQGLLVLVLSALAAWYFFFEPFNAFVVKDANTLAALVGFLLVGGFILLLVTAMRELIRRLDDGKKLQAHLFGELQHRVANNLQVVVALLHQARRTVRLSPEAAEEVIDGAADRIHTMAGLYRRLYDGTASNDHLASMLHEALSELFRGFPINVRLDIPETDLSIGQMTALVLLINEAATNSVKHVFSKGHGSLFEVSLSRASNGRYRLIVRDDGPGIVTTSKASAHHSLGMGIMEAFARQLGGSLQLYEANPGTILTVDFEAGA